MSCQRPQSPIYGPPVPNDFMGRSLCRHANHGPRLSQCGLGPRLGGLFPRLPSAYIRISYSPGACTACPQDFLKTTPTSAPDPVAYPWGSLQLAPPQLQLQALVWLAPRTTRGLSTLYLQLQLASLEWLVPGTSLGLCSLQLQLQVTVSLTLVTSHCLTCSGSSWPAKDTWHMQLAQGKLLHKATPSSLVAVSPNL